MVQRTSKSSDISARRLRDVRDPRQAVILVGGKGTRLRPYTLVLPKPLMPIGDIPILEIVIRQLKQCDFTRIVLAVNHLANIIEAFFGDGEKFGIQIDYVREETPLGTVGPLRNVNDLPQNFLLMNGDILSNVRFDEFLDRHAHAQSPFTILGVNREQTEDYGVLTVNEGGQLTNFAEKPVTSFTVSSGIYAVNRSLIERIPAGRPYGFDDLMRPCLLDGTPVRVEKHAGI